MASDLLSWGRWPRVNQRALALDRQPARLPAGAPGQWLPRGLGRSYGDSCLNPDRGLLLCGGLDRLLAFDGDTGVLRAEAGVSLEQVIRFALPRGWFLPVTPGTRFVTLGGAVAHDVHGKNHHRAGAFGHHVRALELVRSDRGVVRTGPDELPELFRATIGGMGLTGLIRWVELQLVPAAGPWFESRVIRFDNLAEFFRLAPEIDRDFEYSAAWIDCLARGRQLGRGLYICGNPSADATPAPSPRPLLKVPFELPGWLLNPLSLALFNEVYYRKPARGGRVHYAPFLYPLDVLSDWNRIYGRRGFLQWQCVLAHGSARGVIHSLLERISARRQGSFLALLKTFGDRPAAGLLSFPRPGVTLALDFPMNGQPTLDLLEELDGIIRPAGGAQYAAKDARMSPEDFRAAYPRLPDFLVWRDPALGSGFARRMGL